MDVRIVQAQHARSFQLHGKEQEQQRECLKSLLEPAMWRMCKVGNLQRASAANAMMPKSAKQVVCAGNTKHRRTESQQGQLQV